MPDVVLVYPPMRGVDHFEHLGIPYLASFLRSKGLSVQIVDAQLEGWKPKRAAEEISKIPARIIGVTVPFQEYALEVLNFITTLKRSTGAHLVIGGIFPSFAYREILERFPAIDAVVIGEGEETLYELSKAILEGKDWRDVKGIAYVEDGQVRVTQTRSSIKNLDSLPFPARDHLPRIYEKTKLSSMITSRGCYASCTFCSVVPFYSQFGPKVRLRSPENVVDELEELVKGYKVENVVFCDANFTISKERAARIAEEILRRKIKVRYAIESRVTEVDEELFKLLKESGLRRVFLGLESGSQTMLDRFRKGVTVQQNLKALETMAKLDLYVSPGFIMFDDETTLDEVIENLRFVRLAKRIMGAKIRPIDITNKMLPLAGTEYEKKLKEKGKYEGDVFDFRYKMNDPVVAFLYHFSVTFSKFLYAAKKLFPGSRLNWDELWMRDQTSSN